VALAALSWLGSHTIGNVRARLGGIEFMRRSNGTDEATPLGSTRCVGELPRRSSDALKNIHHPNGSEKIFRCKRAFFCFGEKGFGRLVQIRARSRTSINSWQLAEPRAPSTPGEFHPEPLTHRSVLDSLPSHGSCLPESCRHQNLRAPPVSSWPFMVPARMTHPPRSADITPLHHYYEVVRHFTPHPHFRPRGSIHLQLFR